MTEKQRRMKGILLLLTVLSISNAKPYADLVHTRCGLDLVGRWPEDLKDDDLAWVTNERREDFAAPLYRLFTEEDVRSVRPGGVYKINLTALSEEFPISRFLIWAETLETEEGDELRNESRTCEYGTLRSLSDESEHTSYSCQRYLVERSSDANHLDVPFSWQAPQCGCAEINTAVLSPGNALFTTNDDPFVALTLEACVVNDDDKRNKMPQPEPEPEPVDQVQGDQSEPEPEPEPELAHLSKKVSRRRGKRLCCRRGAQWGAEETQTPALCVAALTPDDVTDKAAGKFGLPEDKCRKVFAECCRDKELLSWHKKQVRRAVKMEDSLRKQLGKKQSD